MRSSFKLQAGHGFHLGKYQRFTRFNQRVYQAEKNCRKGPQRGGGVGVSYLKDQ